jgi:hypothetical protein
MAGSALAVLLLSANGTTALAMTTEQRLGDFNQLVSIIQRHYGPLRWKQETIGLDFKRVVADYNEKIGHAKSDAEFYRLLAEFTSELKDAHVSATVPSTYRARLGFLCDLVEGKVLIETIDRLKLPELLFPFKKGDQLLAIGGVDVKTIMKELSTVANTGHAASNDRINAARITSRNEGIGHKVPKGVTTVTVLPKGADKPVTVTATWAITGTPVLELDDIAGFMDSGKVVNALPTANDGEELKASLNELSEFKLALPAGIVAEMKRIGINDIGSPTSMFKLPEGAKQIPGVSVTAAVYEAAGKRIGVLRIPSYGDQGLLDVLARAIMTMKDTTDVLVIDQTNNPGGSVALVSDIISLFADKSYKDMDFEIRPSLPWVDSFQEVNGKIAELLKKNPNDASANALKARFEYLEGEIRSAITEKRFSTAPVSLNLTGTFGMIQPAGAVNYDKPVLMLINEFDFSGGDAFPALMKDNGRVTLFGAQTTGAGGNVREYGPLANSFFKLSLTESLMVRPNGEYMENRGVKPDVAYTVTEDDFMNDYRGYVRAFTIEALKLTGVSQAEFEAFEAQQKLQKEAPTTPAVTGSVMGPR